MKKTALNIVVRIAEVAHALVGIYSLMEAPFTSRLTAVPLQESLVTRRLIALTE